MQRSGGGNVSDTTKTRRRRRALVCMAPAIAVALLLADGSVSAPASAPTPLVQQGAKLTGALDTALPAGAAETKQEFGRSLALSADGNTALVGTPRNGGEAGAALVLVRSGSTWTQQAELTSGQTGVDEGHFGHNVALSADGNTAAISAPTLDGGSGAVWVFARAGSTWTQQAELTGAGELDVGHFGAGLALSPDGNTLAAGAPNDDRSAGAVWIFTRTGSTWAPQGPKLTGGGEETGAGQFGRALALSGEGNLLLVGAPADNSLTGAVWAFARSGTDWAQQGAILAGGEQSGPAHFGDSVALSTDGATALVGGRQDGAKAGAAWVFASSDSTFVQQGPKLLATSGESASGELGWNVALSADGDTALIGGLRDNGYAGAAWLFTRSGGNWTQRGEKLTGAEEQGKGWFGSSVALSADGADALIGGVADNGRAGAVWSFGSPSGETPGGGSPSGGNGDSSGAGIPGGQAQPAAAGAAGAGAPPKQGVGAFKAAGGTVVPVGRSFPVRGHRAAIKLRCAAPVACRGRLTLALVLRANTGPRRSLRTSVAPGTAAADATVSGTTAHRRLAKLATIATARFSIRRERTVIVRLSLHALGRVALRLAGGRLPVRLTIAVSAPAPARARGYTVRLVHRMVKHA
ncbi:MAG TPA: hypothetical protein VNV42_11215 [Solirubrobacteraceae bacterium]|jgi:hypothetical protein|nr:hypothetical protein [Solirubrobacteraceae bacterium]